MRARAASLVLAALLLVPRAAQALTILSIRGPTEALAVGDPFSVEIYATLTEPVLGFGLDLETTGGSLALNGTALGPSWIAVGSADGDGLAGVSLTGLSGSDILLARLEFEAAFAGTFALATAITPGDLGEGFALDPVGFDLEVEHASAFVTVVPEPGFSWLAPAGLLALLRRRRFRV